MRNLLRYLPVAAVLGALFAASMACAMTVPGPTPPASPIPVSTEAAGQLDEVVATAVANPNNGPVTIVVNETQLTSFVAMQLAQRNDTLLSQPQVYLRDNKVELYGLTSTGDITTTVSIALSTTVTDQGALQIEVASANLGPVAMPASMLSRLTTTINDALGSSLNDLAAGVKIQSVTIGDGEMTIVGSPRSK